MTKENKKVLDLLKTAIGSLGYIRACNVSVEDYEYVITADNALREMRELVENRHGVSDEILKN